MPNIQPNEIAQVVFYFEKLGYKKNDKTIDKIMDLADDYPDRDLVQGAKEMYEWFDEMKSRGRKIKSYHATFRNWIKKDYAPRKKTTDGFFGKEDLY